MVALDLQFWLAIRQVNKWAGWFLFAFFAVILVSSVHLGFHYAVDGYVAIALTLAVWFSVPRLPPETKEEAHDVEVC